MALPLTQDFLTMNQKFIFFLLFFFSLCWGSQLTAQEIKAFVPITEDIKSETFLPLPIDQKRQLLSKLILEAEKPLAAEQNKVFGDLLQQKKDLLRKMDLILAQQEVLFHENQKAQKKLTEYQEQRDSFSGSHLAKTPPYSFFFLDKLNDETAGIVYELENQSRDLKQADQSLKTLKTIAHQKEIEARQVRESLIGDPDSQTWEQNMRVELALLDFLAAKESLIFKEKEFQLAELLLEQIKARLSYSQKKVYEVAQKTQFTEKDLKERLTRISDLETEYQKQLEDIQFDLHQFQLKNKKEMAAVSSIEEERVDLKSLEHELLQHRFDLFTERLKRLPITKEIWQRRYLIFNTQVSPSQMKLWKDESSKELSLLDTEYQQQLLKLTDWRKRLLVLDRKVEQSPASYTSTSPEIREQSLLESMVAVGEDNLSSIEVSRRMHRKLVSEITDQVAGLSWSELKSDILSSYQRIVDFEITAVDDRSITVGKIVTAIILIILGWILSRRLSLVVGRRFLRRFIVEPGLEVAIETLIFYVFLVIFVLFALYIANVPLTLFTVLGGALAIAVGFGSQNILNNFISGLIIMIDRPIRVGDLVEIDNSYGRILSIGARCTRILTGTNIDILIPNSHFLEKNVINWTLSDDRIRCQVLVGVAYGSDVLLVTRLIEEAAEKVSAILKDPAPFVLFKEFGASTLDFELNFWVKLSMTPDRRIAESRLRYEIEALFRAHKIEIAYHQTDMHLTTKKPLEIKVT